MTTLTVEAVFEDGVLRPVQPLPFSTNQKVTITVQALEEERPWPADVAKIYKEIAEEDRRLAASLFRTVRDTWPGDEETS